MIQIKKIHELLKEETILPNVKDESRQIKVKQWKVWPGNIRFCCKGSCSTGPDIHMLLFTFFLFNIPMLVFICLIAWNLIPFWSYYVFVISILFWFFVNLFLFLTAFVNPGIVKRSPLPEVIQKKEYENKTLIYPESTKNIKIQDENFRLFYCSSCNIYRPPRTSHCRQCDQCVEKFDHHCPWVGSDVGLRNYRYFILFVFLITLAEYFVIVFSIILLILETRKKFSNYDGINAFNQALKHFPQTLIIAFIGIISGWQTTHLSIYHMSLISQNLTTHEYLKSTYAGRENPFSSGCCGNWKQVFCSKSFKPNFSFSSFVTYNELESYHTEISKAKSKCPIKRTKEIIKIYKEVMNKKTNLELFKDKIEMQKNSKDGLILNDFNNQNDNENNDNINNNLNLDLDNNDNNNDNNDNLDLDLDDNDNQFQNQNLNENENENLNRNENENEITYENQQIN
ncbi:s-acyltransferase [Anaeramoeba ignava]|uniref:Palmitoyltransferase n=1 Tax=Anaeramoeba ignava TaxID=1746090 RepID=A0A9Q0L8Y4_ANAIG|nr:s-acyltransferase [Anaeramoeba ignava]